MSWGAPDYQWSDDLPEGCPPADAEPPAAEYFRVTQNKRPKSRDFRRQRDYRTGIPDEKLCGASSISLYGKYDDAVEHIKWLNPKNARIARGDLEPHMGVVKVEPSTPKAESRVLDSHTNWWVPTDIQPADLFTTVEE